MLNQQQRPLARYLLFICTGWCAVAQLKTPEAHSKLALSIEDAVAMGLQKSQDIRIAASQSREGATSITIAKSVFYPNINASFDYSRTVAMQVFNFPAGFNLGGLGLPFGQANSYTFGLSYSLPLFRPGIFRGVQIAKDYYQSAKDQETEVQLNTVLNICETYYGGLLAYRLAEIAQVQIDQLEAQLKDIRLQKQAGNASDLDVSRVEVNRENVAPQLSDALNARDNSLLQLKRLINVPLNTELVLTDQLKAEGFKALPETEVAELTSRKTTQRAAVRAAERLNRIRTAEIKQAKAAYLPSADINGNIGEFAYPADLFPRKSDWQDNWTIGFHVTIPVFAGGQRVARVRAAQERLEQAQLQLESLLLSVQADTEYWRTKLKREEDLIVTRGRASQQASRAYDLTELSYKQGTATHLDLTDARTSLRLARANEVQTVHDYYTAYLRLIRSVGVPPGNFTRIQSLSSHQTFPGSTNAPAQPRKETKP